MQGLLEEQCASRLLQLTPMVSFPTLDAAPQIPVGVGVLSAAPDVFDGGIEAVRDGWIEVAMGGV